MGGTTSVRSSSDLVGLAVPGPTDRDILSRGVKGAACLGLNMGEVTLLEIFGRMGEPPLLLLSLRVETWPGRVLGAVRLGDVSAGFGVIEWGTLLVGGGLVSSTDSWSWDRTE
jgi:hypothetical protein